MALPNVHVRFYVDRATSVGELLWKHCIVDDEFPWSTQGRERTPDDLRVEELQRDENSEEVLCDVIQANEPVVQNVKRSLAPHQLATLRDLVAFAQANPVPPASLMRIHSLAPNVLVTDIPTGRQFVPVAATLSTLPEWPTINFATNPDCLISVFHDYVLVRMPTA